MNTRKTKRRVVFFMPALMGLFFFCCLCMADLDKKEEDAFYAAARAYEEGCYDFSLTLFERFLRSYGDEEKGIEALVYIGQCYFYQGRYTKALNQFEFLLKMEEAEFVRDKVLFWLAEVYARARDYAQAAEFYKKLIQDYKDSYYFVPSYKSLAQGYRDEGRFQEAVETYRELLSQSKDSLSAEEISFKICETLYQKRDYRALHSETEGFIFRYPHSQMLADTFFYLGEAQFGLRQYEKAVVTYRQAEELFLEEGKRSLARIKIGWSYLKLARFGEAQKLFSEFGDQDQPLDAVLGRAVLMAGLQDYKRSFELFDEVIKADLNRSFTGLAFFGRAEALYHLGHFKKAAVDYQMALKGFKEAPGFYDDPLEMKDKIHAGLAMAYLKSGDLSEAYKEAQEIASGPLGDIFKIDAFYRIGSAYQEAGDCKKAIEVYQSFLKDYSESVHADYVQYQLAMSWLEVKNLDAAALALQKLLRKYPHSLLVDDASYFLGVTYFQKKDFRGSQRHFETFLEDFKESSYRPEAIFLLGESLVSLGEFMPAIQIFGLIVGGYSGMRDLCQRAEYEISSVYVRMGDEAQAYRRLSDFIMKYSDSELSPEILFWLARYQSEEKSFSQSRTYYERFIRNYPQHELLGEAFLEIGLTYLKEGHRERALKSFQKAQDAGAQDVGARAAFLSGDVSLEDGDLKNALLYYQEAAFFAGPLSKTAYLRMARVYKQQNLFREAVKVLKKASCSSGVVSDPQIQFEIGELLEEEGLNQEALEAYLEVLAVHPAEKTWTVKTLLRLARIYEDQQDWPQAEKVLRRLLAYDVPEAKYAREKLAWLEAKSQFK